MAISIAHLGPSGTNAEAAALWVAQWLQQTTGKDAILCPYPSIPRTLHAVAEEGVNLAVVPVENSIEGSVTTTLDTLWKLNQLRIQQALVLPITHALLSHAKELTSLRRIYSHPQALAQCQSWLETHLSDVQLIPTNSTTEALQHLDELEVGAIASDRAAQIYNLPVLACPINDYPDNCTRFWVLSLQPSPGGKLTSLAFSVYDRPGALVKALQVLADRTINLTRIESRPTKRSLGDYLFFIDVQADLREPSLQEALLDLTPHTEILKIFGSYDVLDR
jgi:prephenate dehydratase